MPATRISPIAIKALVITICCFVLFAVAVARFSVTAAFFKTNTLDHSWLIGLAAALQQGQISGRDFFYTYGVLAQALAWLGVWLNGGDSALDSFFAILLCFQSAAIILFGVALGLIKQARWKQVSLISLAMALLAALFQYAAFRMMLVLLCAVSLQYAMSASSTKKRLALAAATGILCLMAQLVTAELGIQTILMVTSVIGAYAVFASIRRILQRDDLLHPACYLLILGVVLIVFVTGNVLVSLLFELSSPTYQWLFDYQRYSLEIMRGYNNTMGIPWKPSPRALGWAFLLLLYVTAFVFANLRKLKKADGYLLFSLLVSSWVALKGMILRSDWGHTTLALIPTVFLLLLMGLDWLETNRWRISWVVAVVLLFAIWPGASFSALVYGTQMLTGELSLSTRLRQILSYRATLSEYMPAGLVEALPDSSRPMLSFPYQNYISIGLRRKPIAPILQTHIAHTESLQQKYVEALAQQKGAFDVVYGLDFLASWPVDNVQNVSRVPIIFEYLYRNYELQSPQGFGEGFFLLRPRRQPLDFRAVRLPYALTRTNQSNIRVKLDEPASCSLVRLELRIIYPIIGVLGRPDALHLQFLSRDTDILQTDAIAIETDRLFSTYVSLIDAPEFYKVFGAMPGQSKRWDALQISPRLSGLLGVPPDRVDIGQIECIRLDGP